MSTPVTSLVFTVWYITTVIVITALDEIHQTPVVIVIVLTGATGIDGGKVVIMPPVFDSVGGLENVKSKEKGVRVLKKRSLMYLSCHNYRVVSVTPSLIYVYSSLCFLVLGKIIIAKKTTEKAFSKLKTKLRRKKRGQTLKIL